MNIWVYENDYSGKIKVTALGLIRNYLEYSMPIPWCTMLEDSRFAMNNFGGELLISLSG